jgi:hypothetical protein
MGTTTAPIFATAQYTSSNSMQLGSNVAILSPFCIPRSISAFASRFTLLLYSLQDNLVFSKIKASLFG